MGGGLTACFLLALCATILASPQGPPSAAAQALSDLSVFLGRQSTEGLQLRVVDGQPPGVAGDVTFTKVSASELTLKGRLRHETRILNRVITKVEKDVAVSVTAACVASFNGRAAKTAHCSSDNGRLRLNMQTGEGNATFVLSPADGGTDTSFSLAVDGWPFAVSAKLVP